MTKRKAVASSNRPRPVVAKAGLSRNPKRRYGNGGRLMGKGGKCK